MVAQELVDDFPGVRLDDSLNRFRMTRGRFTLEVVEDGGERFSVRQGNWVVFSNLSQWGALRIAYWSLRLSSSAHGIPWETAVSILRHMDFQARIHL